MVICLTEICLLSSLFTSRTLYITTTRSFQFFYFDPHHFSHPLSHYFYHSSISCAHFPTQTINYFNIFRKTATSSVKPRKYVLSFSYQSLNTRFYSRLSKKRNCHPIFNFFGSKIWQKIPLWEEGGRHASARQERENCLCSLPSSTFLKKLLFD